MRNPFRPTPKSTKSWSTAATNTNKSVGIAVGVVEPSGRRIIAYGILDQNDPRPITGDSVFEIGSITKLFTSLLLADMIKKGEVALNDPLSKYLPSTVRVPEHNGHIITLPDLSRHTSGLPREASSVQFSSWDNAEGGHSLDQLYEFFASYKLT
jgi:D-alanyl-D-alanine-carboxypeptidase/D-alanyl-D-alanine-endopeptidase